eukprot:132656-Chlamydomonas_euryale.AAC.1
MAWHVGDVCLQRRRGPLVCGCSVSVFRWDRTRSAVSHFKQVWFKAGKAAAPCRIINGNQATEVVALGSGNE